MSSKLHNIDKSDVLKHSMDRLLIIILVFSGFVIYFTISHHRECHQQNTNKFGSHVKCYTKYCAREKVDKIYDMVTNNKSKKCYVDSCTIQKIDKIFDKLNDETLKF